MCTTSSIIAQGMQNVELHGYMLNRFYTGTEASSRFVMERLSLSAVAQLGKDGQAYAEIYFHPWLTNKVLPDNTTAEQYRTYLESAYVDLPMGSGRIRVGKGRQLNFGMTPSYPNRKTTQYGIVSETFTQDRIIGAQFCYNKGTFDGGLTLFNDQPVGKRKIGDYAGATATTVVEHFVDKDVPSDITGKLAIAAKIGVTNPCWKAHISGCSGKLRQTDANMIAGVYGTSTNNLDHNKYGVDAMYTWAQGKCVAQAEWYQGNFSFLKITGFSGLIGYQPKDKTRTYVRYALLNNNQEPNNNSLTWDTKQWTIGVVQPIRKGVWAELQYERNLESTGGYTARKNDLIFLEIFSGF